MGSHLPVQQLEHLDVELSRLRARSNSEVSIGIALDDLHGGDLAVSAKVGVRDVDDGVDVRVRLLDHLRQVLHCHQRVVQIHLRNMIKGIEIYRMLKKNFKKRKCQLD